MTAIQERLKKMEVFFDQEEFVVLDNGSGFVKAGFSGEDLPRCVIPTVVSSRKIETDQLNVQGNADAQEEKYDMKFSNDAYEAYISKGYDKFEPIQRSIITDFDHMENLWEHIFEHELNLEPKNINLLMTDSPFNTKKNKQQIADIMFDKFKIKSLCLMNTAVLSLFATGKTSGIVTEVGEGTSYATPVFEGYALPHAKQKLEIAGKDITEEMIRQLSEDKQLTDEKIDVSVEKNFQHVREIKEQMGSIALNYESEFHSNTDHLNEEQRSYELPGGKIITVDLRKRISSTEILFNPLIVGSKAKGIAQIAYDSIEKCDSDLKIVLYNNIELAGGSTMIPGFYERFDDEIKRLAGHNAKTDINTHAVLYRNNAAWIGGSMMASFSTFGDMTIKRELYETTTETDRPYLILRHTVF